jgi:adenosine deaminase
MSSQDVAKVDLHVHLEGTISPEMMRRLSARNGLPIPRGLLRDDRFYWMDDGTAASALTAFLRAYDGATSVIRTPEDYTDLTYDYLMRAASEKCIYVEMTISPDHGRMAGISYPDMLTAIEAGYLRAREETGTEMRLISTCVRHYGPTAALKVGQVTRDHPHPLVTGFGMAGDENSYTVGDFQPAFDISGLPRRTAHAGEAAGPESIRAARDVLGVTRFGHMVRIVDDIDLMKKMTALPAVPEVCVSSNIALKVYPDYASHPLRRMFDAGLKVTLGSDDPTFFNTTIGREYQIAQEEFGFSDDELRQVTRNALEEAFVDEETRSLLLTRL